MIINLKTKIKETLEAIVQGDGTKKIVVVYNYPELKPTGYPYAFIIYKGYESEELTNREERVTHKFEVNLIQEKIEELKGRSNAETTTDERTEVISEAFRQIELTGLLRIRPIEAVKLYEENATRINIRFTLEAETIENI
jgi:hypothetical protein